MEGRGELGLSSFVVSKGMGMGITEDRRGPSGKILPGLKMDLEEALCRLREVFAAKGVVLAYLFGSYAEGTATPKSDLDIAVLVEGGDLYESYRELFLAVREALGTERFNRLLLNGAPLSLKFEVVSHGRLIYCRDEDALNEFEMDVIRKYQDTAYLRAVQDEYRKERAKQWYSEGAA